MVTITICIPNSTQCFAVPNMLIDSGSTGVRIFSSVLPANAESLFSGTGQSECYYFAGNNVHWGPVKYANVQMGGETANSIPIMIIDSSYGDGGKACLKQIDSANGTPAGSSGAAYLDSPSSGYNGILGVKFLMHDCDQGCVTNSNAYPAYYNCSGTTCTMAAASLNNQVVNPVGFLPHDNNGIVIQFPAVNGLESGPVTGYAIFGIGTQDNNTPPADLKVLQSDITDETDDCYAALPAVQAGSKTCSFLDTGSRAYFLAEPRVTTLDPYGFYQPTSPVVVKATLESYQSNITKDIQFTFANEESALNSPTAAVFPQLAAQEPGAINTTNSLDLGIPYYFGRTVYMGFEGKSSTLGHDAFWAF